MKVGLNERPADGHLDVEIKASEEGMTLRQPQLIRRFIELLNLADANPKPTPVFKPLISKKYAAKREKTTFIVTHLLGLYHVCPDAHG